MHGGMEVCRVMHGEMDVCEGHAWGAICVGAMHGGIHVCVCGGGLAQRYECGSRFLVYSQS
jgi:hypothetical protein